jgi:hypothetical protein
MGLGLTLASIRHGYTATEADRRIRDLWDRGLILYSELETKSTKTTHVGSTWHGVRVVPLGLECAAGCGWETTVRP